MMVAESRTVTVVAGALPKRTEGTEPVVAKFDPVMVTVAPPAVDSVLGDTVEMLGPGADAVGMVKVAVVPAVVPRLLEARTVK